MKLKGAKSGAITYYILVVVNALYGLLIAPYLLEMVGKSEYGVYKTISSLTASIIILDLGIGSTMQRYIARFLAEGKRKDCSNFTAMGLIQAAVLSLVIAACCVGIFFSLDHIYDKFTASELLSAKYVFALSVLYVVVHVFENVINGVICGFNKFAFANSAKLIMLILRVVLYFVVLPLWPNATAITLGTVLMEIGILVIEVFYLVFALKVKIKLEKFDLHLFADSMKYTSMMLVQTIAAQVNSNLDNVFVGSILGTAAVSVYSFGLALFNMFQPLSTSISSVMLPMVTNEIVAGADNRRLEDLVIKVGRIQFLLLASAYFGFAVIGKEFVQLYLGSDYLDVWVITLILMSPSVIELSQNVCLSILRARNQLGFRSIALITGVVMNVLITFFGTPLYGYYAAAVGTAISTFVSGVLMMNFYYYKVLKLNVFRILGKLIFPVLPGILLAAAALVGVSQLLPGGSWLWFAVKILVFFVILLLYLLLLKLWSRKRVQAKE